ncbi:MAG: GSCFA domain-containing protein [Rhodobacteraceae bacterium]|nr:GSCFA domain-containing protein [Paracoccaceae bacterium]
MTKQDKHATCPYRGLPETSYWRNSVAETRMAKVQPVQGGSFTIGGEDLISTAGSCFAQHIAQHLLRSGFGYFVPEEPHWMVNPHIAQEMGYGVFSARYANIYTTRQLLQTFQRAYGEFEPKERVWKDGDRYIDPFRPFIQPDGFATQAAFDSDQEHHFASIRRIVEESSVFVFTLGLTEAWVSKDEGIVFPVCPGCGAGTFDEDRYEFKNFRMEEVRDDLLAALKFMRARNPDIKVLLTVSPVPLIATAEPRHVLTSTIYSKSVLRVAAEEVSQALEMCDYFPSYEIITGQHAGNAYYEDDFRSVKPEGVAHVMRCFSENYFDKAGKRKAGRRAAGKADGRVSAKVNDLLCEEEKLVE